MIKNTSTLTLGEVAAIVPVSLELEQLIMTRFLRVLTVSVLLALFPVTTWPQGAATMQPLSELERMALSPSRDMIELGRSVASTACAQCHGTDGASIAPGMPHIAGQRTVYIYRMLQAFQTRERTNDPMNHAVGFLNEEAMLAVSTYFASQLPVSPSPATEVTQSAEGSSSDPFAGIRGSMKKCIKCHGKDGNSDAPGMPSLSAQDPEYFVAAMNAYRDGDRAHKLMKKLVTPLDQASISQMGVFYAVQVPTQTQTQGEGDANAGGQGAESCANCHGADGNATGSDMPTLAGQDARYFIKAMAAYRDGERQHEGMFNAANELSESELQNLATFYAAQEPVRRNVHVPFTSAEWMQRCERCHGLDGNSSDPRFPMLAGQDVEYLKKALEAYSKPGHGSGAMHAMTNPLSADDIRRISEHYSMQQPKSVIYLQLPCEQ
jgi:cytochrome c553